MAKARSLVGLDVHATKIVAAVLDAETGQLQTFAMSGENTKAAAFCTGLPRPVRVAYEAGPTGYGLARELSKRGIECIVAAPSKIPRASGDRVKTDRRDAEHLVRLLLAGKLHAVRVPGDEEEALRDLVRARDSVRMDLMRCRHRLSKLLLRHGIRFDDGAAWTQRHRDWLGTVTLDWPAAQATLLDARGAIDALAHRREQLEREIVAILPGSPWVVQVGRLRCLRGVDTLTAVGLCAEIGDFERFARAEQLMRRPVSTPRRVSGCRLAVKRCALGPAGRRLGDGGAEHPLGGSEVGPGARRSRDRHQDMLLQAAMFGGVVGGVVLPAAP
jgi:transposase